MVRRLLLAASAVVLLAATTACGSGELDRSANCDDEAQPARNVRLRSTLPPGAPPAPPPDDPAQDVDAAQEAFRPSDAGVVYCEDFADPFVLSIDDAVGHRLFTFGTQNAAAQLPVLSSSSVLQREELVDALPALPAWSEPGGVWAPAAAIVGGQHLLYYATIHSASGRQCISVAASESPAGPYVDGSLEPFVCPVELGGAIDPSLFTAADGSRYLLWKNDGNCCDLPTAIFSQLLGADGVTVAGPPVELVVDDQGWEGGVVESPAMVEHEGAFFLFYSANAWNTASYAVGYATCAGPQGPCTKAPGPWLASAEGAAGPGGLELFLDGAGELRAVFHAWIGGVGYDAGGTRQLFTTGIDFVDGVPVTSA